MLNAKGGKQRGYIWAYVSGVHKAVQAVIYEIKTSRSGQHVRDFVQHEPPRPEPGQCAHSPPRWRGHLVVDDSAGYKALFGAVPHSTVGPGAARWDDRRLTFIWHDTCFNHGG